MKARWIRLGAVAQQEFDAAYTAIAAAQPRDLDALSTISGIGTRKLERYGPALLRLLREEPA